MTTEEFRALALSLPEAVEAPHGRKASFRVGKKMFATMTPDGSKALLAIPQDALRMALLEQQPDTFVEESVYGAQGVVGVVLERVDRDLLAELLAGSYASVAPRRALEQLARLRGATPGSGS